jgi:hypothetical protein
MASVLQATITGKLLLLLLLLQCPGLVSRQT